MKKESMIAGCIIIIFLVLQSVPVQAQRARLNYRGGERITLTDGRTIRGIISKFEKQKVYVATTRRGSTLIQRGETGPGVVVIRIDKISRIDWRGRDDDLKKRIDKAVEQYFSGDSLYEKQTVFGNLEGERIKTTYDDPFFGSQSETEKNLRAKLGYSYIMKREREFNGYYLEGRLFYDYNKSLDEKSSFVLSGVSDFEDASADTSAPTGGTVDLMSIAASYSDYGIAGYKHYLNYTPYFAFGELQMAYDYRVAAQSGIGNDVPNTRLFFGFGWGRVFNIAESSRAKTIEKELLDNRIIRRPFSRPVQKEVEEIFKRSSNPQVQTRELFQTLRNRRYIRREPTLEQSFNILQTIEDSFSYRLEGLEIKGGLLSHVLHQVDDETTTENEEPFDPTMDIAFYVRYYKPIGKSMQFEEEGTLLYHIVPSPTVFVLFSNTTFDYKYSKEVFIGAYNLLVYINNSDPDTNIVLDEIGAKLTYYIAEQVSVSTKVYHQIMKISDGLEFSQNQSGARISTEYTF